MQGVRIEPFCSLKLLQGPQSSVSSSKNVRILQRDLQAKHFLSLNRSINHQNEIKTLFKLSKYTAFVNIPSKFESIKVLLFILLFLLIFLKYFLFLSEEIRVVFRDSQEIQLPVRNDSKTKRN